MIGALESQLGNSHWLLVPQYACSMARLKYAMDIEPLPHHDDIMGLYEYYKRIFNTDGGKSTGEKWVKCWYLHGLDGVKL